MKILSARSYIIAGFLVALAFVAYFVYATYDNMLSARKGRDAIGAAQQNLIVLQMVLNDMQAIETGHRGYVISGKKNFLDPYNSGIKSLGNDTLELLKLNLPKDSLGALRSNLLLHITRKLDNSKNVIGLRDSLGPETAALLVMSGKGKEIMDSIRVDIYQLEDPFREYLSQSGLAQQHSRNNVFSKFFILTSVFFVVLVLCFALIYFNIRKKENAERELKKLNLYLESEVFKKNAELSGILERITDGFIALDKDFRYTYVNRKTGDLVHMDPASLIGKKVWDVFPDVVGSATYEAFHRAMETQEFVSNIDYYAPFDLWQENNIYPSPRGLSVFIRDISAKKRAEQKLLSEKELSDSIVNGLPGIFYLFDSEGKFIRWNKNFETISGYSGEEVAKMHPLNFFHEDDHQLLAERIGKVFETGFAEVEADFYTKDKRKIPYYFNGVSINYEGKNCLIGMGIDIGVRKEAERLLILSENKYRLLFEDNPMPLWMFSLDDLHIIDVNESAIRAYGYSREEFTSMTIADIRPKEDVEMVRQFSGTAIAGIRNAGIWRHIKKDGTVIKVEVISHDTQFNGRNVRLVLAIDVTERLKATELLEKSYNDMRELASHLQDVREEERASMAREVHDELGQQLTGIRMDVSWLTKKMTGNPEITAKLQELIQLINGAVRSVRKIATELRPSILDDLGLVAAMEWQCDEFGKKSGISVNFSSAGGADEIPENFRIGLFRILQESLTNIARHANANNITVKLNTAETEISLEIQDDGVGFVVSSIAGKKTLGLMGMKERTLMMGGKYEIESAPGKGARVSVTVPVKR